jgi:hypothetical protein
VLANEARLGPTPPDESMNPFDPTLRREGRDPWPTTARTMIGVRRLENVRELAQRVIDRELPGDFIETGVWRGGCCIFMRVCWPRTASRTARCTSPTPLPVCARPNRSGFPKIMG